MAIQKRHFVSPKGRDANRKFYKIKIWNNRGFQVIGDLKNNFNFSLNAEYANLFSSLVPGAEFLTKIGNSSLTTGIFSKLYYKGGSHLVITSEFRILDEGESLVSPIVRSVKYLSNMLVADPFSISSITSELHQSLNKTGNFAKTTLNEGKNLAFGQKKFGDAFIDTAYSFNNYLQSITNNNRIVKVQIGDFFRCEGMVITSLTVTYSRELTHTGPLYCDINVSFQSLEAIHRGSSQPYGINALLNEPLYNIKINGEEQNR